MGPKVKSVGVRFPLLFGPLEQSSTVPGKRRRWTKYNPPKEPKTAPRWQKKSCHPAARQSTLLSLRSSVYALSSFSAKRICPLCPQEVFKSNLKAHLKEVHSGSYYFCDVCLSIQGGRKLWRQHELENHGGQTAHTILYDNAMCQTKFLSNGFVCDICKSSFKDSTKKRHHFDEGLVYIQADNFVQNFDQSLVN